MKIINAFEDTLNCKMLKIFCGDISNLRLSKYSITCFQRAPKGSNKSGLLQQVVFKCRFCYVDLTRSVLSEQWSLRAGHCLIQVVSNTSFTVLYVVIIELIHS